jgi:hypothetical protein
MEQANNTNNRQRSDFNDFLSFRKMIALNIIQVVYAIIAVVITLKGASMLFSENENRYGYGYSNSIFPSGPGAGIMLLTFGNVFWRLWCEFIIVLFRINQSLSNIDNNTGRKPQPAESKPVRIAEEAV